MCEVLTVKHLLHTPVNMGPKVTIFSKKVLTREQLLAPWAYTFLKKYLISDI